MSSGSRSEDYTSEDAPFSTETGDNDISKDKMKSTSRRKRSSRLRRCNTRMLVMSVVLLMALCGVLILRVSTLNGKVERLTAQLENLTRLTVQQREQMDRLMEEARSAMEDSAVVGSLDREEGSSPGEEKDTASEAAEEEVDAAHKVYLTFDDGPSANTQDILDILEEYGVKATFFVVGDSCEKNEEMLKKIVEAGHTLGMHSYSHDYSELYESVDNFAEDLKKQQDYLYEVTGVKSTVYRFPGGSSNRVSDVSMKEFARYLDSQGIRFFDWNVSSGDGGSYLFPVETIFENCTSNIGSYGTSVVLMHDVAGKTTTREALPAIIEEILEMEDTVILPITGKTELVQHIKWQEEQGSTSEGADTVE